MDHMTFGLDLLPRVRPRTRAVSVTPRCARRRRASNGTSARRRTLASMPSPVLFTPSWVRRPTSTMRRRRARCCTGRRPWRLVTPATAVLSSGWRPRDRSPFRGVKPQFGHAKLRYRGLTKNTARLTMLFALCRLWMARRPVLAAQEWGACGAQPDRRGSRNCAPQDVRRIQFADRIRIAACRPQTLSNHRLRAGFCRPYLSHPAGQQHGREPVISNAAHQREELVIVLGFDEVGIGMLAVSGVHVGGVGR